MNSMSNGHGNNSTFHSFSNGNMGPAETMADWYAGSTDDRLLSHWWAQ